MYYSIPARNSADCEMVAGSFDVECFVIAYSFKTGNRRSRDNVGPAVRYTPIATGLRCAGIPSIADTISTQIRTSHRIDLRWIGRTKF